MTRSAVTKPRVSLMHSETDLVSAPIPANEAERLSFLREMKLDPTLPFDEIQGLCEVAASVAGAPIALVSLIEETQQNFLASVGLGELQATDREISFCAHAIMGNQQFEVENAQLDVRFSGNPFVVEEPRIRSYLGTVLEPEPEMRLGTLCVLDTEPKHFSEEVKARLSKIGKAITSLLVSHREKLELIELTLLLQNSIERSIVAEKAKTDFLSMISHELRTPLTSIKGSLGLMKVSGVNADSQKSQRLISIAYENSERLLFLVNDILRIQKNEFNNLEAAFVPVDLSELIEASAEAYRSYGAEKDVSLTVTGLDRSCIVSGDRKMLDRVIANILSNAFKFSKPRGNVEIALHMLDRGPQIAVKDDGAGIPEGSKEKVFGMFSQVDSTDTRSQNGTGLGMHICKQILKQHNATIDYESEIGVGTTFVVNFSTSAFSKPPN